LLIANPDPKNEIHTIRYIERGFAKFKGKKNTKREKTEIAVIKTIVANMMIQIIFIILAKTLSILRSKIALFSSAIESPPKLKYIIRDILRSFSITLC